MTNETLISYIREQQEKGVPDEATTEALREAGWHEEDIHTAFAELEGEATSPFEAGGEAPAHRTASSSSAGGAFPGAFSLLAQAWEIYTDRFALLLGIIAIPGIISILGSALPVLRTLVPFIPDTPGLLFSIFSIAAYLLAMAVFVWGMGALVHAVVHRDMIASIGGALSSAWRHVLSFVWVYFLLGFIIIGGFGLLIIPGILFFVWVSSAPFILAAEDERGMNALLKSREYVRGRWWRTLWRRVVILVVAGIPCLLIPVATGLLMDIPNGRELVYTVSSGASKESLKLIVSSTIPGIIVWMLITPLLFSYNAVLYEALRDTRGSFAFAPSKGRKAGYIILGSVGFIILIAVLTLLAVFGSFILIGSAS